MHRFWECAQAQAAWQFAKLILQTLAPSTRTWNSMSMKQCIFAARIPRRFRTVHIIWLLTRGSVMWTLWIATNDVTFNQTRWDNERIKSNIWRGVTNYGRNAWASAKLKIRKQPYLTDTELTKFDQTWGKQRLLCSRREWHIASKDPPSDLLT